MKAIFEPHENEKKLIEIHKTWLDASPLILWAFGLLVALVFTTALASTFSTNLNDYRVYQSVRDLMIIGTVNFLIIFMFIGWLDYYFDLVIVTNERLVFVTQNALFGMKVAEVNMDSIQDVSSQTKGFWGSVFSFGSIMVQTAGERENFIINNISHPHWVAQKVMQVRRDYFSKKTMEQADRMSDAIKDSGAVESKKLGEMLLEDNLINRQQLAAALSVQKKQGGRVGSHLVEMGYVEGQQIADTLSRQKCCPSVVLSRYEIDPAVIKLIPRSVAYKFNAIPVSRDERTLTVAMADPQDAYAVSKISEITSLDVVPVVDAERFIKKALEKYYPKPVYDGRILDEKEGMFWQGGEEMPADVEQTLDDLNANHN